MRRVYLIGLLTVLPMAAQEQRFSFGVKGGVPAQTPLGQTDSRMPFVLGPTIEFRMFSRLSLESGVMFHRFGQRISSGAFQYPDNSVTLFSITQHGRALEIPILLKSYLLSERRSWRPFVAAGPTVRRTSLNTSNFSTILSGTQLVTLPPPNVSNSDSVRWKVDPVAAAGIDCRIGRFHLAPEVRYSYWSAGKELPVRKSQVEFQLGFRF
jgi:hypothetical protein